MSRTRSLLAAVLTLGFAAVWTNAQAAQTSPDEKAIAAYRLTMPTVKKVMAVTQSFVEEAAKDPKVQELAKLKADIAALEKKEELTEAEQAQLDKLHERRTALEESESEDEPSAIANSDTLADMEAKIRKHPAAMRVLAREGLSPREYALCMMTLLQASLIEGFSQGKADINKLPAGVNPENLRFIRENKAELEAMQRAVGGAVKK